MSKYLFIVSLIICNIVFADVPADQVREVDHLTGFIKSSSCIFNRNGTDYPAAEVIDHIMTKYDYFRGDISSTEEFIEYSATKSTMSGKYYTVSCGDEKTIRVKDWLLAELDRFRDKKK